jgi:hypothetical protein
VPLLNEAVEVLLSELRKDAVPLVDSFDFSDHFLNSSLGRYNGALPLLSFWCQPKRRNLPARVVLCRVVCGR